MIHGQCLHHDSRQKKNQQKYWWKENSRIRKTKSTHQFFSLGTCKMRNEIETRRNETKRNEINRNETNFTETKRGIFRFFSVNFVSIRFVSHFTGIPIKMLYFSDVSLILNQTDIIFTSFLHFILFSVKVKTE
jgi:hypothetical protein